MEMKQPRNRAPGMTLVEILLVVLIMAVLMAAVAPLVRTSYYSWITADRRAEMVGEGRIGMSKLVDEIRLAYDVSGARSTYIDYYPQWATAAYFRRFDYENTADQIFYGLATPTFASSSLAAPVDFYSHFAYTRKMANVLSITSGRKINSFKYVFTISDERGLISGHHAQDLNPMYFRSMAHLRGAREGYFISKRSDFTTENMRFDIKAGDQFCIKMFNDRINPWAVTNNAGKQVQIDFKGGNRIYMYLQYVPAGDYFATCCANISGTCCGDLSKGCSTFFAGDPSTITMTLSDTVEWSIIREQIQVVNPP